MAEGAEPGAALPEGSGGRAGGAGDGGSGSMCLPFYQNHKLIDLPLYTPNRINSVIGNDVFLKR